MCLLAVLVVLALVSPVSAADVPKPSEKVTKLLGEKSVGLFTGATKVEVFRIDGGKAGEKEKTIGGYRILAAGKEQDAKFAAKLATVVLDEESYDWRGGKGCIFQPGVAFRVWKGDESVVVVICFSCDQVRFIPMDKDGKPGKPAFVDSDPSRAELVKLAKTGLPDDKEIQKLKEQR
jgi:hypothetical protein